jgi:hypothetical protein
MSCQAGNVWNRPIFSRIGLPKINSVTALHLSLNEGMNSWTQSGKPNDQWQDKEYFVNSEPETEPESSNQSEHRSIEASIAIFGNHFLRTTGRPCACQASIPPSTTTAFAQPAPSRIRWQGQPAHGFGK